MKNRDAKGVDGYPVLHNNGANHSSTPPDGATPEGCLCRGVILSVGGVYSNNEGTDMEYLHVSIEINGVVFEVIGNYWLGEAASWDSPEESNRSRSTDPDGER